jgi:hypothetical protein
MPISTIINASFKESEVPGCWKLANICPIPKNIQVIDVNIDLRPTVYPLPTSYPGFSLCGRGLKRTLAKAVRIIHNLWIILSRGMYEQGGGVYRLLNVVSEC